MKVKDSYLLKRPKTSSSVYQSIIKESVNWKYLSFEARKLEFKKEFDLKIDIESEEKIGTKVSVSW